MGNSLLGASVGHRPAQARISARAGLVGIDKLVPVTLTPNGEWVSEATNPKLSRGDPVELPR
jgi:hypothetical protein